MPKVKEIVGKVNRADLLAALELVEPGLTSKVQFQQAGMVVLRKGVAHSYNDECYCRVKTGIDPAVLGAVAGKPLLEALRKMADETVSVTRAEGVLVVKGRLDTVKVRTEDEIALPIEGVDKPGDDWKSLKPSFADGIEFVKDCCGPESGRFDLACVHVHPDFVEACDNFRIIRYRTKTRVSGSVMVLNGAIRHVARFAPTRMNETRDWLHYKSEDGNARLSVRKYWNDKYPDFDDRLTFDGDPDKLVIPTALVEGLDLVEVASGEDKANNDVTVTLSGGKAYATGQGAMAVVTRECKAEYTGPDVSFRMPVRALRSLAGAKRECEVKGLKMLATGDRWVYHACLKKAGNNGQ